MDMRKLDTWLAVKVPRVADKDERSFLLIVRATVAPDEACKALLETKGVTIRAQIGPVFFTADASVNGIDFLSDQDWVAAIQSDRPMQAV